MLNQIFLSNDIFVNVKYITVIIKSTQIYLFFLFCFKYIYFNINRYSSIYQVIYAFVDAFQHLFMYAIINTSFCPEKSILAREMFTVGE